MMHSGSQAVCYNALFNAKLVLSEKIIVFYNMVDKFNKLGGSISLLIPGKDNCLVLVLIDERLLFTIGS